MHPIIQRELDVAFSRKTQPIWFRVVKWTVFLGVAYLLRRDRWMGYWLAGVPLLGICMHIFYRWKTRGWTQSWGGWDHTAVK